MPAEYATSASAVNPPRPRFSVIMPVLGEAAGIGATLDAVGRAARAAGALVEVVIADGDPRGSTLAGLGAPPGGLAEVRGIVASRGRARQMNAGAAEARGDIFLFLHADTVLPVDAFSAIEDALARETAAGAFALSIDSPRRSLACIAAMANLRSRLLGLPFGDQAFFLPRQAFERLGGFADLPLMEDVDLVLRLRRAGHRPRILPQAVRTSARRWEKQGAVFCTLRNWSLLALWSLGVPAGSLARFYRPMGSRNGDGHGR